MSPKGRVSLHFLLKLLFLLFHVNTSLALSLKHCTLLYQENAFAHVSLDCTDRSLKTVPDDLPTYVVSADLSSNLLLKINKDDFLGLTQLRFLNLEYNSISYVDDGAFLHLGLLKTLYMNNNYLVNLTSNMFQGLSNLTELNLSKSNIQFIHNSAFRFLISLKTLDLSENYLQKVVDIQSILQLPQIQKLIIACNQFSSFETKDLLLNISSNLKELEISGDNLKKFSITTPIFPFLHKVALSVCTGKYHNNLTWGIPDKSFLRNITVLFLDGLELSFDNFQNILQSLDSLKHLEVMSLTLENQMLHTVCNIPTLQRLDSVQNILNNLTFSLAACSQLRELNLCSSSITELPKGSIQPMERLRSLSMDENQLTRVPFDVRSLASLEILILNQNSISELSCEDFLNTTNLSELYLIRNHIVKLDRCVFESLTNLKLLGLSNNFLTTVTNTFKNVLHKLEVLDLCHNSINYFEDNVFKGLESLKRLDVESVLIEEVEFRVLYGLKNLKDLTISFSLDSSFDVSNLKRLENLTVFLSHGAEFDLHHSNVYEDSVVFDSLKSLTVTCGKHGYGSACYLPIERIQAMKQLENIKAKNVLISQVETYQVNLHLKSLTLKTDFSGLDLKFLRSIPNLQTFDLSESINLKSLDFLLQANLTALRYLKVTDNEINVINETVFSSLPSLTYLDLSNNPFTCECSNAAFIQWIKSNKQTLVGNTHRYKCSFPVDKQGTLLLDFDIQPCWNDDSFFYFLSSTCLVVLTLLTSFIYHFLRWQLVYTYHLLLAFLYDSRRRKGDPHQFDAFVSYNVHDEDWVHREMLPVLEGEQGWRLCLHHRDFQPGKPIIENITDAIYGSRKTICVISRHYLQSEWCSKEIQMARWGRCLSVSSSQAGLPTIVSLRYSGENLVLTFGTPWDGMGDWDGESTYDA